MKIGVLALQGAFKEHIDILKKLNVEAIEVRTVEELKTVDGLILPGGESTTIGKLLKEFNISEILIEKIKTGFPVFGTCAGMILLAKEIVNDTNSHLAVMDISVLRNAYGRQLGSFYCKAPVRDIGENIEMSFIRAPYIENVYGDAEILSEVKGHIVAARQRNMLVTSFHPEISSDYRIHQYFIDIVKNNK